MKKVALFFPVISMVFSFGCVKIINPNAMITDARKMVELAKAEKAGIYAPDNLEVAEKELSRAEQAFEDGNGNRALGWARRACVDAELAGFLAKSKRFKTELEEINKQQSGD